MEIQLLRTRRSTSTDVHQPRNFVGRGEERSTERWREKKEEKRCQKQSQKERENSSKNCVVSRVKKKGSDRSRLDPICDLRPKTEPWTQATAAADTCIDSTGTLVTRACNPYLQQPENLRPKSHHDPIRGRIPAYSRHNSRPRLVTRASTRNCLRTTWPASILPHVNLRQNQPFGFATWVSSVRLPRLPQLIRLE